MRRIAMGAMALAGLSAFAQADHTHQVDECLSTITAAKDYFTPEAGTTVAEARKFDIEYHGAYKVLTNVAAKRQYVLYPCGGQPPAEADLADVPLPAGYQRKTFSVPAQKAVTAETVSYDFMTMLENDVNAMGVTDRILALSPYATNACAQKALKCETNRLVEGVKPSVPGWGAKAEDYQPLMDAAQVYFDSSDSKAGVTGDKSVIFSATQETSLLGRGEWIKFAAAFFNLDHVADKKFEETKAAYIALSAKAKAATKKPKVLFIDIDTWASQENDMYTLSLAGYKRSAVLDAGGWIPNVEDLSGSGATIPANMRAAQFPVQKAAKATEPEQIEARQAAIAKFQQQLLDADVIIDERYAAGVLTLEQALAAYGLTETDTAYKAIAGKKWFRQDKTGSASGSAWFETAVSRPELVLKDFIKVIHPQLEAVAGHQTVFLRDLFAGEGKVVLTPEDCQVPHPICDLSLEAYPDAPICPPTSYKSCVDNSKVFLSPASGCTKFEKCSLNTYVDHVSKKVSEALPVSTSITLAVFMAFVALVLLAVGFLVGKKKAGAKKNAQQVVSPDARFGQGAQLH